MRNRPSRPTPPTARSPPYVLIEAFSGVQILNSRREFKEMRRTIRGAAWLHQGATTCCVPRQLRHLWAWCPGGAPGGEQARAANSFVGVRGSHSGGAGRRRLLLAACGSAGIVAVSEAVRARNREHAACEAAAAHSRLVAAAGAELAVQERGAELATRRAACDEEGPGLVLVAVRLVRHVLVFAPLVLLYLPCRLAGSSVHDQWWSWAIFAIEASGPALVKLGQWAATRGDMFPSDLCRRLAQLHANARTHRLALSAGELQELLRAGDYVLVSIDEEPIGSGCIAQVHRAIIAPRTQQEQQQQRTVAVKLVHPGVHSAALADIEALRYIAGAAEVLPRLRFLSLRESVDEFASLLQNQLDLRREADNLERFAANFEGNKHVDFPQPIRPLVSSGVLVETLQPGEPLSEWLSGASPRTRAQKQEVARIGVAAFLDMCFSHNFIHGDLHPGNILVYADSRQGGEIRVSFLDAGITSELSPVDRRNFVNLFAAIVKGDGRLAGRLMAENARSNECSDIPAFCDGIERLVNSALGHKLRLQNVQAASILAQAFALACMHRVKIESNFANVCIAIMVLEGVGRELDPTLDILQAAAPVVLRNLVRVNFAAPPPVP